MKTTFPLVLILGIYCLVFPALTWATDKASVDSVLNQFHAAASDGDWDTYFSLFSEDAIFLGTDASERWNKAEFEGYARNTQGWTYTPRERHINFTPDGNTAWFDELLWNENYGLSRGTGVLILTDAGWRVSQYHLTFPIPNALVERIIPIIRGSENGN